MAAEHDWLMIGSEQRQTLRVYKFRCKFCFELDESFSDQGPPKKRYMLDDCEGDRT